MTQLKESIQPMYSRAVCNWLIASSATVATMECLLICASPSLHFRKGSYPNHGQQHQSRRPHRPGRRGAFRSGGVQLRHGPTGWPRSRAPGQQWPDGCRDHRQHGRGFRRPSLCTSTQHGLEIACGVHVLVVALQADGQRRVCAKSAQGHAAMNKDAEFGRNEAVMVNSNFKMELPRVVAKRWVTAVRRLANRGNWNPADTSVSHAQPP